MVHKLILTAAIGSLFLLSGCGQPAPDMGAKKTNAYDADTVSIDESGYGRGGMAANGNSSSDGFQSIYFGFDQYNISPDMEAYMTKNTNVASSKGGRKIKVEGNCDEFGSDEYNYALGLKRAKAVKDALAMQGIPSSQMVMVSYGESNPVCSDSSETCYSRNRRVDLRLAK
jgi:peptidoglycan-associated lipoprotein